MLASIKLLSLTLKLLVSPSKEYSDRLWTDDDIPTKSEHGGAHGRNPLSSNLSNPRSETRLPGRKDTKKMKGQLLRYPVSIISYSFPVKKPEAEVKKQHETGMCRDVMPGVVHQIIGGSLQSCFGEAPFKDPATGENVHTMPTSHF